MDVMDDVRIWVEGTNAREELELSRRVEAAAVAPTIIALVALYADRRPRSFADELLSDGA